MTFEEAKEILAALAREGVEYVLVGSMGMAAQGLVRATRDIDLFISSSADNIERLRAALDSLFHDPSLEQITSEDLGGAYPAVEYTPPHGRFSLDILARLGTAFSYENLDWEELEVEGVRIRVATPQALYEMKKDTVRPRDAVDAAWIKDHFGLGER